MTSSSIGNLPRFVQITNVPVAEAQVQGPTRGPAHENGNNPQEPGTFPRQQPQKDTPMTTVSRQRLSLAINIGRGQFQSPRSVRGA